jgi:hypothetical protein
MQKERNREKETLTTERWGSLFPISGTKATSAVSESRGIAPFGQLAREQRPHAPPTIDPATPLLPRSCAMNETTRVYGCTLTTLALYLLQVLQCRLLQCRADSFHKPFVSPRRFRWNVVCMMIPRSVDDESMTNR